MAHSVGYSAEQRHGTVSVCLYIAVVLVPVLSSFKTGGGAVGPSQGCRKGL